MDSYRRFVRSPLYQNCTLASVESQPLPQLTAEPVRMRSWENVANRSPTVSDKRKKSVVCSVAFSVMTWWHGLTQNKQSRSSNQGGKNASEEQRQKRVSWGGSLSVGACVLVNKHVKACRDLTGTFICRSTCHSLSERVQCACKVDQRRGSWLPLQAGCGRYIYDIKHNTHFTIYRQIWLQEKKKQNIFHCYVFYVCRMDIQVPAPQRRVVELVGSGWKGATAVSTYLMAVPLWPLHVQDYPLETCSLACVRREASRWKMSSFTSMATTRWSPGRSVSQCFKYQWTGYEEMFHCSTY